MTRVWICAVTLPSGSEKYESIREVFDPAYKQVFLEIQDLANSLTLLAENFQKEAQETHPVTVRYDLPFTDIIKANGRLETDTKRRALTQKEIQEFRTVLFRETEPLT